MVTNVRYGRTQKALSATTAACAIPLGIEIWLEHIKGSFGDPWMWSPILLSPVVTAGGIAGFKSERAARTVLPAIGLLYSLNGMVGIWTHFRGIQRRPGGFSEPLYNVVMGPPLLAPGSLALIGSMGILAAFVRRER